MREQEQSELVALFDAVSQARDQLEKVQAGAPDMDDDLQVACRRLDNWLLVNAGSVLEVDRKPAA